MRRISDFFDMNNMVRRFEDICNVFAFLSLRFCGKQWIFVETEWWWVDLEVLYRVQKRLSRIKENLWELYIVGGINRILIVLRKFCLACQSVVFNKTSFLFHSRQFRPFIEFSWFRSFGGLEVTWEPKALGWIGISLCQPSNFYL